MTQEEIIEEAEALGLEVFVNSPGSGITYYHLYKPGRNEGTHLSSDKAAEEYLTRLREER